MIPIELGKRNDKNLTVETVDEALQLCAATVAVCEKQKDGWETEFQVHVGMYPKNGRGPFRFPLNQPDKEYPAGNPQKKTNPCSAPRARG